jgi:hypothetical protein
MIWGNTLVSGCVSVDGRGCGKVDNRGKTSQSYRVEGLRCPHADRVVHSAACEFCYSSDGMAADVLLSGAADARVSSDLREYLAVYGSNGALTAAVVAVGDTLRNYAADATVRRGAEGPVGLVSGCTVRLADRRL